MERQKIDFFEEYGIYYVAYDKYDRTEVYNHLVDDLLYKYFGTKKTQRVATAICEKLFDEHHKEVIITDSASLTTYRLCLDGEQPEFKEWMNPFKDILSKEKGSTTEEECFTIFLEALNLYYTTTDKSIRHPSTLIRECESTKTINMYNGTIITSKLDYLKDKLSEEFPHHIVEESLKGVNDGILLKNNFNLYNITFTEGKPVLVDATDALNELKGIFMKRGYFEREFLEIILEAPEWVPKGYTHVTGTLETGYVIADDKGSEYVYIPDIDVYVSRYIISKGKNEFPMSIAKGKPWNDITLIEAENIIEDKICYIPSLDRSYYFRNESVGIGARLVTYYDWLANFLNEKLKKNPSVKQDEFIYNISLKNPITCFTKALTSFASYDDFLDISYHGMGLSAVSCEKVGQKIYFKDNNVKLEKNNEDDIIYPDTIGMGFRIVLMKPSHYLYGYMNDSKIVELSDYTKGVLNYMEENNSDILLIKDGFVYTNITGSLATMTIDEYEMIKKKELKAINNNR